MVDSSSSNLRNIALAGIGAVALSISLFFLSRDELKGGKDGDSDSEEMEEKPRLNESHTFEKLKELLEMTHIELTCTYVRTFNRMLQARERQRLALEPSKVMEFEKNLREQITKNKAAICEEYGITPDLLSQWVNKFKDADLIKKQGEQIQ